MKKCLLLLKNLKPKMKVRVAYITRIADKKLTWKIEELEPSVELPHQTHNSSPYVQ